MQMFWHYALENDLDYFTEYSCQVEKPNDLFQKFLEDNKDLSIYHFWYIPSPKLKGYRTTSFETILVSTDKNVVVRLEVDTYHRVAATIAGVNKSTTDAMYEKLLLAFPEKKIEPKTKRLKMDFWYMANRPTSVQREISVPDWSDVKENYTPEIQTEVEKLIKLNNPVDESKLLILNGKPGCGKTYLLRTLLWEWRAWAKPDFVLDPEAMFARPDYLLRLVLDEADEDDDEIDLEAGITLDQLINSAHPRTDEKKWRVIVLEDADSFISSSAKVENGQSMSRLLNILDGLVGQGLKILFIITANEDEQKIHEAIKRPGRCLANITFEGLSKQQALDWLAARGLGEKHLPEVSNKAVGFRSDESRYTLAQLYQVVKEHSTEVENASQDTKTKEL
jgi:SpoVK/Ycf46/Vps4 family AAA+-type ATPase